VKNRSGQFRSQVFRKFPVSTKISWIIQGNSEIDGFIISWARQSVTRSGTHFLDINTAGLSVRSLNTILSNSNSGNWLE